MRQGLTTKFKLDWRPGLLLALVAWFAFNAPGQTRAREDRVKATLLYNFSLFVDWPDDAFPSKNAPFVIGILGDDPFGGFLDDVVKNERRHGHPVIVRRFSSVNDAASAHILYIGQHEQRRLDRILRTLKNKPVLTVGDVVGEQDFAAQGGMIAFVTENSSIHLRINLAQCHAANLQPSAKLLQLAKIVEAKK